MTSPDLESLVYVSSAVKLLDIDEIAYLLKRARERNREYDVTGVLLYIGGNFMQYLEGPPQGIDTIYRIICDDPQHRGIILISREPLAARQFGDWSMGFRTRDFEGYVGAPGERRLQHMLSAPPSDDWSPARILLQGFWTGNR